MKWQLVVAAALQPVIGEITHSLISPDGIIHEQATETPSKCMTNYRNKKVVFKNNCDPNKAANTWTSTAPDSNGYVQITSDVGDACWHINSKSRLVLAPCNANQSKQKFKFDNGVIYSENGKTTKCLAVTGHKVKLKQCTVNHFGFLSEHKYFKTCPDNSWPALMNDDNREHLGNMVTLDSGLEAYYVAPQQPSKKSIIVYYTIVGMAGARIKSIADHFSNFDEPYHVILPNFFRNEDGILSNGGPYQGPPTQEQLTYSAKVSNATNVMADTEEVVEFLKRLDADMSIGGVGYCWGAWAVFHASASGLITAGASAHPSLGLAMFEQMTVGDLAAMVNHDQLIMPTMQEDETVREGGIVQNTLEGNGLECRIIDYSSMLHGFTIDGDISVPEVKEAVKTSTTHTMNFMKEKL